MVQQFSEEAFLFFYEPAFSYKVILIVSRLFHEYLMKSQIHRNNIVLIESNQTYRVSFQMQLQKGLR